MTKQIINVGTTANDKKGDSLRTAFQKVNTNFTELYTALGLAADTNINLGNFVFTNNTLSLTNSSGDDSTATQIEISQPVRIESDLTVGGDIIPVGNLTSTLGSPNKKFHSIYVGTGSVYLGDARLSLENGRIKSSVGFDVTGSVGEVSGAVQWDNVLNAPAFSEVAVSGSYDDLTDKPAIPADISDLTDTTNLLSNASWSGITGKPSMFDIGGNVIGLVGIETPMSTEGTIIITKTSQIDVDAESIVITKSLSQSVDDGTTTTVDSISSTVEVIDAGVRLKKTLNPDGPNNSDYSELLVGNVIYLKKAQQLAGGEEAYSSVNVSDAAVQIISNAGTTKAWTFEFDGTMTLPDGGQINDADGNNLLNRLTNGNLVAELDSSGTINTPLLLPRTFTAVLDEAHMVSPRGLGGNPWQYGVSFDVGASGAVQVIMDDPVRTENPGYVNGDVFRFIGSDHGIPGYNFEITLITITVESGNHIADVSVTPAPVYPSTINSLGAIKLTATGSTVVPGQQITAADNQGGVTNNFITVWVEGGGTNYPEIVAVQPGWTVVGEGLNYAEVVDVELITQFAGAVIYRITTEISSAKMGHDYTFIEPDGAEPVPQSWVFGTDGKLTLPGYLETQYHINTQGSISWTTGSGAILNNSPENEYFVLGVNTNTGTQRLWNFNYDGTLTLPEGGDILDSNGDSVLGGGSTSVTVSDTAPGTAVGGDLWWDSENGRLKIYYADGDTSQWVDAFVSTSTSTDRLVNGEHEIVLNTDGSLTFPDNTVQTTAVSLDQLEIDGTTILTEVDESIAIQTSYRPTITAIAADGSLHGVFVTDISNDDDIIVVNSITWEVNIGDEVANWVQVQSVVTDPGVTCTIEINGSFMFVSGTSYTFRNTEQVEQSWTFRDNGAIAGPGGLILSNETADAGEDLTYRELAIELPTPDGLDEHRWVFANDGDLTAPGDITASFFIGQTLDITNAGAVFSTYAGDLNTLYVTGNVGNGITLGTDGGLTSWLFKPDGSITLPTTSAIQTPQPDNGGVGAPIHLKVWNDNLIDPSQNSFSVYNDKIVLPTGNGIIETPSGTWSLDAGNKNLQFPNQDRILYDTVDNFGLKLFTYTDPIRVTSGQTKHWDFGTDGSLTFPDATEQTTAYAPVTGQWAVPIGTNTYSFTVLGNGTYSMWVRASIPNGIIVWNATVTVTNANVPAIGQQFAWNYTNGGSPILLTSIPNQIVGTAGTISTNNNYSGSTANTFEFGISNTSGDSQIVHYGYTKI